MKVSEVFSGLRPEKTSEQGAEVESLKQGTSGRVPGPWYRLQGRGWLEEPSRKCGPSKAA